MRKGVGKEVQQKPILEKAHQDDLVPITESQARDLFKHYASIAEKNQQRSLSAFLADPLIAVVEGKVYFTVGSKTVAQAIEDETEKLKQQAVAKGWEIVSIACKVNPAKVSEYKVFTPEQQFEAMAKEHPILKDFKTRFNLDFEP